MPKAVNITIWIAMGIAAVADCYAAILANTFYLGLNPETEPIQFGLRVLIAIALAMMSWLAVVLFFHSIQPPIKFIKIVRAIMFLGLMVFTLIYNIQNSLVTNARDYHPIVGVSVPLSIPTPLGVIYIHDVYLLMLVGFAPSILPFFALLQPTKKEPTPAEMQAQYEREKTLARIALDRAQTMAPMQEQLTMLRATGGRGMLRGAMRGLGFNKFAERLEDHQEEVPESFEAAEETTEEERVATAEVGPDTMTPKQLAQRLNYHMREVDKIAARTVQGWLYNVQKGGPIGRQFLSAHQVQKGTQQHWVIRQEDVLALQEHPDPRIRKYGQRYVTWLKARHGLRVA